MHTRWVFLRESGHSRKAETVENVLLVLLAPEFLLTQYFSPFIACSQKQTSLFDINNLFGPQQKRSFMLILY